MPITSPVRALGLCAFVVSTLCAPRIASATAITFSATGVNPATGTALAASAKFDIDIPTGRLMITLTNTSMADVLAPSDVLTAVFFDVVSPPAITLTPATAVLAAGSSVVHGAAPMGGVVGGEWAYGGGLSGAPNGAARGISSTTFGAMFGNANFTGPNLAGPGAATASVGGVNYGITSRGDNIATGNAAVTGGNPLIKYSVVFKLGGVPVGFDPSTSIYNVSFQYGTSFTDPNLPVGTAPIPEPTTWLLLAGGLAAALRRSRRKNTAPSVA